MTAVRSIDAISTDERLRLERWLTERLRDRSPGCGPVTLSAVERPAAGQSSDLLLLTMTWEHDGQTCERGAVLRRQPCRDPIFLETDVVREARVLDGLAGSGIAVPSIWWIEPDPAVLGAPYFVMERLVGRAPTGKPSIHKVGWLSELTAAERQALWQGAMATLVAIHAVDWRRTHSFLAEGCPPAGLLDRHLERLVTWYGWTTAGRSFPITDAALEYLLSGRRYVADAEPVLLWGDARVGNMMFAPDHTVAGVVDWELAGIGHPAIDVAHWLFFDEFATDGCGVPRPAGWCDRAETVARYVELSGRELRDLVYFEVMESFVIATTLIRQADAHVAAGRFEPTTRMGHDNAVTQMLARRLGLPVPPVDPDYLTHRGVR